MRIFALADFHLSLCGDKPMTKFGVHWENHPERIAEACRDLISDDDLFLIPGDHSWGLRLDDAEEDLRFIESLPGKKVLCKGNHDYWWQGIGKVRERFPGLTFLQNDAVHFGDQISCCGTRGWSLPSSPGFSKENDEKYLNREVHRLKLSLEQLNPDAQLKIALIHYPPLYSNDLDTPFSDLLAEAGVDLCVYGHIHLSKSGRLDVSVLNGRHRKVLYQLVSCDTMGFVPWELDPRKLKRSPDFLEGAEAAS
jgi:predicted phosphohydrolase